MRSSLRLSDLLARLPVLTGDLPATGAAGSGAGRGGDAQAAWAGATVGLSAASRASILDPLGRDRRGTARPARVYLPFVHDVSGPDEERGPDERGPDDGGGVHGGGGSHGAPGTSAPGASRALGASRRVPALQVDETTCGAAVLAMLAMAGDPRLALHVARDPARRFADLQHRVHRACARSGPVPWPRRLGTSPWGAAAVARYGGTRYTHRVVGGATAHRFLAAALTAAASGVPVPLYTGGDLAGGWQAAVPRHVVLLVDAGPDAVRIYEPSSATMHTLPARVLLDPGAATARERAALAVALGRWPHVVWVLLPR